MVAMKTCDANRALAGCRDVVLRAMESVSTEERVDPRMIELRTKMLLKGNLGGSSGQSVRSELERNSSMLKKGAGPLPVAESGFAVSGDATAKLSIFARRECCCRCSRRGGEDGTEGRRRWVEGSPEGKVVGEVEVNAAKEENGFDEHLREGCEKG